jgi:hypothetical protein
MRDVAFSVYHEGQKIERELNEANAQLRSLKLELKESYELKDSLVKGHLELGEMLKEANADRLRLLSFIKELNATKFAHGREYRSKCGKFLQALSATPPPVVAKSDADALADAVEIMRVGICSAAIPNATEREIAGDAVKLASELLKTYRNKYQEGNQ